MNTSIHYITNEAGERTAVQIPWAVWEALKSSYYKLLEQEEKETQTEADFAEGLKEAFQEVSAIQAGKKKYKLAQDFLDEL
jgi:hypothetical protein